jgi:hypothetical protein
MLVHYSLLGGVAFGESRCCLGGRCIVVARPGIPWPDLNPSISKFQTDKKSHPI